MNNNGKLRRILMFHGLQICNNVLNVWSDAIADEFRNKGIDVGFIDLNKSGEDLADEYVREINKGFDAAVALNSYGQHETTMAGESVFDYLDVPFYNWILDHPCEHTKDILSGLKKYHIICIDRDHAEYVKRYFPNIAGVHFIPLGAKRSIQSDGYTKEEFAGRKYDVIFTGSCFSLEEIGNMIGNLPEDMRVVSTDMIEYMVDNRNVKNEEALKYALRKNNIVLKDEEFRDYAHKTAKTNPFVRGYIRKEMICYAAESGVRFDLFGEGWDDLKGMDNLTIHGSVSYAESVELCSESKISFNVMPLFKDGLHDRIPTAMLMGSAVLTDTSTYINEIFNTDGSEKELLLYDISCPETIGEIIKEALDDPDKLYEVAERGRIKAEKKLTWEQRVEELIRIIEGSI